MAYEYRFTPGKSGQHPEETDQRKQIFYKSLEENLGLVFRAATKCGIPAMTHHTWLKADPLYKEACEKLIELKRDHVEHHLNELVAAKDPSCTMFVARCLLRPRNYDQSSEIKTSDNMPLNITISADVVKSALKQLYDDADNPSPGEGEKS